MKQLNNILIMLISFLVTVLVVWFFIKGDDKQEAPKEEVQQSQTEESTEAPKKKVKLAKGEVLKINDKGFTKKDIDFLRNMQKAQIDIAAQKDKSGDDDFYKQKIKDQDSENLQLQNQVELEAIALLGKEKGYKMNDKQLTEEVKAFKKEFGTSKYFKDAEKLFDKAQFDKSLKQFIHDKEMRGRVIEEIKKIKKADNPKLKGQELDLEVRQYFDDLYKDAVNDLSITTNYE